MFRLSRCRWLAHADLCAGAYLLFGCGRVGIELLPIAENRLLTMDGATANEADANVIDAGANLVDAASNGVDAGAIVVDAGANVVDAGAVGVDAGANVVDASTDAGTTSACSRGYEDCDGNPQNGCETPLDTALNCGVCGKSCPLVPGGTPVCSAGMCGASCDLSGTFALQIIMQTTWPNATYISAGSGQHVFWLKLRGTQSGTTVAESLLECGRSVPDFRASMVNETYNFSLPTGLFDAIPASLQSYAIPLTLSGTAPGASVALPTSAFLIGTTMTNPTTATWPSTAAGLTQVDTDGDGNPGATLSYLSGGGYSDPLVSPSLGANRAQQPYSATRLVFSLSGTLTSCTQSTGAATVTHIDTRIFGCKLTNGAKCNGSEANFLDTNCLKYNLGAASYKMIKIADIASCADVRAALP